VILRRAIPQDASLLFALFAADRAAQFAATGLTEAQYRPLLDMQYKGRAMTYSAQYPDAEDWIVCIEEGSLADVSHASMEKELAVGRCLLARTSQGPKLDFRLVDLAILPQFRDRGIATQVLQQLAQQSAAAGAAFSLQVEKQNPALRLYERLGFFKVSGDELSYEMEWRPPTSGSQPRPVAAGAQLPTPEPNIPLLDGTSPRKAYPLSIPACSVGCAQTPSAVMPPPVVRQPATK
jgi:ribosomal protein S18 acetylase RimI-like enzyme